MRNPFLSRYNTIGRGSVITQPTPPPYPLILEDGNTIHFGLWDDLTTIVKDGSDFVSVHKDKLGSGNDLTQLSGARQPKWDSTDGIKYDGLDDLMQMSFPSISQPISIYMVLKQKSHANVRRFFDGGEIAQMIVRQWLPSPNIQAYAGQASASNSNMPIDTFVILRVVYNGASSKLQINQTTPVVGDFGSNPLTGFTEGAQFDGFLSANIWLKERIIRKIVDSTQDDQDIYDYLKNRHNIL